MIKLEYVLFVLYVLLGPITWFLFGLMMFERRGHMYLALRPHPPLPQLPPKVSILIPAKDEGERIRACLESALDQDYPDFDVTAIDDRSTDCTGAVMDDLAAQRPALKVLHLRDGQLPAGWTGKCNALHSAVKQVGGRWLAFVDSDVVLARDAVSSAVEAMLRRRADMLSFLPPGLECHTFWEKLIIPLAGMGISTLYLVSLTNNDRWPRTAFANGQFMLFKREAYESIGGHERVKDRFCEDVEMARLLKLQGKRVRLAWGTDFVTVRMYSSLAQIFRGWGRNFYAADLGRPWRLLLGIFFIFACCYSAYVAIPWAAHRQIHPINLFRGCGWLAAAMAHLFFMTSFLRRIYSWSGNRAWLALLFPLGATMMLGIFLKALWMCVTRQVEWRGTRYSHRMAPAAASAR